MTDTAVSQPERGVFKKGYRAIGIILSIIPIVWIFTRLNFQRLTECLHRVAWWMIPVMSALIVLSMALQGIRWWIMVRALIPDISFKRTMAYHFIGVFYSIVLPSGTSTDIIKTVLMSRKFDYSIAWGATWLCRIIGFAVLVALSGFGLFSIDRGFLPKNSWLAACVISLLVIAVFVISFSKRLTGPLRPLIAKLLPKKIAAIMENVRQGIYLYRNKTVALVMETVVTLLTQTVMIVTCCFVLWGITGKFFLAEYFAFIPIIEVLANSGPTPNGVGVREALTAIFFKHLHVSNEQLGIYVFLTLFFTMFLRLIGGIPLLHGMIKNRLNGQSTKKNAQNQGISL